MSNFAPDHKRFGFAVDWRRTSQNFKREGHPNDDVSLHRNHFLSTVPCSLTVPQDSYSLVSLPFAIQQNLVLQPFFLLRAGRFAIFFSFLRIEFLSLIMVETGSWIHSTSHFHSGIFPTFTISQCIVFNAHIFQKQIFFLSFFCCFHWVISSYVWILLCAMTNGRV